MLYLSFPCFTRTATDEVRVNFAKDFQAIGLFKVLQVRAGTHPASSGRINSQINHRHEEKWPNLKSETSQIQRNMCQICAENKPTAHMKETGLKSENVIGEIRQWPTIFGEHIDREF